MATVTVTPPSVVKVEVGNKPTNVQSINYGSRTLRGASDLVFSSPNTGDVIAYNATTGNFPELGPWSGQIAGAIRKHPERPRASSIN